MDELIRLLQATIDKAQSLNPVPGSAPGPQASESERVYQALMLCQTAMGWLLETDGESQ
jgi:hypothetical protein